jgi:hypothetical protein
MDRDLGEWCPLWTRGFTAGLHRYTETRAPNLGFDFFSSPQKIPFPSLQAFSFWGLDDSATEMALEISSEVRVSVAPI